MTTDVFIKHHAHKHAPFNVVFIDADHSAEALHADFWGILPHVADDGLILMHDTNPETLADTAEGMCGDAWRFVRDLSPFREMVTLNYHPGLTIFRKRDQWGPNEPRER